MSGGLLQARYSFNPPFAMTSGVALVVLVPLLAQTVATTEHLLARQFPGWLRHFTVGQIDQFGAEVRRYWLGQWPCSARSPSVVAGLAVVVGAPRLGSRFVVLRDPRSVPRAARRLHPGVRAPRGRDLQLSVALRPVRPDAAPGCGVVGVRGPRGGGVRHRPRRAHRARRRRPGGGGGVFAGVAVALATGRSPTRT